MSELDRLVALRMSQQEALGKIAEIEREIALKQRLIEMNRNHVELHQVEIDAILGRFGAEALKDE